MLSDNKMRFAAFLITLFTVLIYFPALQKDFVNWDDDIYVYKNPAIWSLDLQSIKWMFTSYHASNWHPLTWLSHALDYAIWGLNPMGHHLTSILIHGLNTFLVVMLIAKLVRYARHGRGTGEVPGDVDYTPLIAGAVTGFLFGVHPLHVESVAWVSERKDVLYAFFYLLSILTYLRYVSSEKGSAGKYLLCLLFFIFSLMSKPMAVTLPVVLIILDIYPLGRLKIFTKENEDNEYPLPNPPPLRGRDGWVVFSGQIKVLLEKIPFFALSIISSIIAIKAQQAGGSLIHFKTQLIADRILIAFRALIFYVYKLAWPSGLVPYYPYPDPAKVSFLSLEYMGACILVIIITTIGILMWKRQKVILTALAYYAVTLFPVLGIVQVGFQSAADRYTYMSALGPFMVLGTGVGWIFNKLVIKCHISTNKRILFIIPAILILGFLSFLTIKQQSVWKDSISLWTAELNLYPDINKAYDSRAEAYMGSGNYQKAVEDLKSSIRINPQYATSYFLLGMAYEELNANLQAVESYNKAIELYPQFGPAHFNRKKAYQNAQKIYLNEIRQNPQNAAAYVNRGTLYALAKMYKEALEDFNLALTLNPRMLTVYFNRGLVFAYLKDYRKALNDFETAIELNPADMQAYYFRGLAHEKLGDEKKAHIDFQAAARLGYAQAQEYLKARGLSW